MYEDVVASALTQTGDRILEPFFSPVFNTSSPF